MKRFLYVFYTVSVRFLHVYTRLGSAAPTTCVCVRTGRLVAKWAQDTLSIRVIHAFDAFSGPRLSTPSWRKIEGFKRFSVIRARLGFALQLAPLPPYVF